MEHRNVRVRARDAFVHVTLARAERRNTLSFETIAELDAAFAEIGAGKARGVLLDAEGPVFSAGHDFADMAGRDLAGTRALLLRCAEMMQRIQRIPQPVLASVAGLATAAGCQLVATCDLAVASSEARFATPGGRGGWFCHTPMVAVSRAVGSQAGTRAAAHRRPDRRGDRRRLGPAEPRRSARQSSSRLRGSCSSARRAAARSRRGSASRATTRRSISTSPRPTTTPPR